MRISALCARQTLRVGGRGTGKVGEERPRELTKRLIIDCIPSDGERVPDYRSVDRAAQVINMKVQVRRDRGRRRQRVV